MTRRPAAHHHQHHHHQHQSPQEHSTHQTGNYQHQQQLTAATQRTGTRQQQQVDEVDSRVVDPQIAIVVAPPGSSNSRSARVSSAQNSNKNNSQNSDSFSSNEISSSENTRSPVAVSPSLEQKLPTSEQRIKVTLSAPPSSSAQQEQFTGARRQSTATLISALDSNTFIVQQQHQSNQASNCNQLFEAAGADSPRGRDRRSEQDSELLRIASQRRRRLKEKQQQQREAAAPGAGPDPINQSSPAAAAVGAKGKQVTPSGVNSEQQQQPQQLSAEPSAKQLAIYINGKIRSNSIFCRPSSSCSSFNGLLAKSAKSAYSSSPVQVSASERHRQVESLLPVHRQTVNYSAPVRSLQRAADWLARLAPAKVWLSGDNNSNSIDKTKESQTRESSDDSIATATVIVPDQQQQQQQQQLKASAQSGYKLNPSSMFLRKAMRYYRIWIYCTNITILLGALTFILATLYVASDYRIRLLVQVSDRSANKRPRQISSDGGDGDASDAGDADDIRLSYTEPSVLVAYTAIAMQAGLLQAIGCFGAVRMRERWIQAFWYLILALTVFDVASVVYWFGRYEFIVKSLRHHMATRLSRHYGHLSDNNSNNLTTTTDFAAAASAHRMTTDFDKILTEIIDKIQSDSQCCGISSSLDYKRSEWRRAKLAQLSARVDAANESSIALMRRVPLVPASCCRRQQQQQLQQQLNRRPVILDDAQVPIQRVPAWSPSMVVEELRPQRHRHRPPDGSGNHHLTKGPGESDANGDKDAYLEGEDSDADSYDDNQQSLSELIDGRWTGRGLQPDASGADTGAASGSLERRRLAKERHYARARRRRQRWTVESRIDDQDRVVSRLISDTLAKLDAVHQPQTGDCIISGDCSSLDDDDDDNNSTDFAVDNGATTNEEMRSQITGRDDGRARLATLRRLLFKSASGEFRWPNKLGLNRAEFATIESYLLADDDIKVNSKQQQQRRNERSPTADHSPLSSSPGAAATEQVKRRLADAIRTDDELQCAPASYYDQTTIYTRGCHQDLRAWLDSSAHILFVTGFCVLSVLKFCSLVLLRLEIREMIHKIRVLKGMATEYNALHDLEAYLPRASVSAAAAELTPSGVAPIAAPSTASIVAATASTAPASPGSHCHQVVAAAAAASSMSSGGFAGAHCHALPTTTTSHQRHRIGGSFSEAVVAATAARQQQQQQQQQLHQQFLQHTNQLGFSHLSGRAASMKAMAAMSAGMLAAPPLPHGAYPFCPRSSSAHLHAAASSLMATLPGAGNNNNNTLVSQRRHTAISVCPAAAAAAAAAQHLFSRRGTYVGSGTGGGGGGGSSSSTSQQSPLLARTCHQGGALTPVGYHLGPAPTPTTTTTAAAAAFVESTQQTSQHQYQKQQQHRHSAHNVQNLLAVSAAEPSSSSTTTTTPTTKQPAPGIDNASTNNNTAAATVPNNNNKQRNSSSASKSSAISHQFLGDDMGGFNEQRAMSLEHQSSAESANVRPASPAAHVHLLLAPPFKRQSAGNVSLAALGPVPASTVQQLPPALHNLPAESRRSIH